MVGDIFIPFQVSENISITSVILYFSIFFLALTAKMCEKANILRILIRNENISIDSTTKKCAFSVLLF